MTEEHVSRAEELFERKAERRRELAQLPVEEKIKIVVKLQRIASDAAQSAGRDCPRPWDYESGADTTSDQRC